MRDSFFLLFFSFSMQIICSSKTYVTPLLGIEYSEVKNSPDNVITQINDPFWASKSFLVGINAERHLFQKTSIYIEPIFTRKKVSGKFRGIVGYEGYVFDNYRFIFGARYKPVRFFHIGVGGNITLIDNLRKFRRDERFEEEISTKKTYGLIFSTGFNLKNIKLNFSYLKGFTSIENGGIIIDPIDALIITLGYSFKL